MRYRIECHFGSGWEWYADTDTELDAYRWQRTLARRMVGHTFACRIVDTSTGRIISSI